MSTKPYRIFVDDLPVEVVRKETENLYLGVYPPDGRVRVAAPFSLSNDAVRIAVATRLDWIERQQKKIWNQVRQSEREYVSGEKHYLFGQPYVLNVVCQSGRSRVEIRNEQYLDLYVREGSSIEQRASVMIEWYREHIKEQIPPLVRKWEREMEVEVAEWGVRRMKTKWGSCNAEARRIWVNLELAKKPLPCLEYVIVHQMVHLLESKHNEQFEAHMDNLLPQWRHIRDELDQLPLPDEVWER